MTFSWKQILLAVMLAGLLGALLAPGCSDVPPEDDDDSSSPCREGARGPAPGGHRANECGSSPTPAPECQVAETWYQDADGDGYGNPLLTADCRSVSGLGGYVSQAGDCDDTNPAAYPGATEACNGKDDNCDGAVDEGFDVDSDGYRVCGVDGDPTTSQDNDCDDTNPAVHPGAVERPNGRDDDCDGLIDE